MNIVFLEVHFPGSQPQLGGFVILDTIKRRVFVRSRCSWDPCIDPGDAEILSGTPEIVLSFFESADFDAAVSMVLELSNIIRATGSVRIPETDSPDALADTLAALLLR